MQCDLSDPPLPKLPTATNAEDALREEVDWSEPWALLVKQYQGLRKCVAEHNEKAKGK